MLGTWLADIEASPKTEPTFLDKIRSFGFAKKAFLYFVLSFIFLLEMNDPFRNLVDPNTLFRWFYYRFSHFSLILICLTSPSAQRFLMLAPIQYLGKISYGFYLLQQISIEWIFNNVTYEYVPHRDSWWMKLIAITSSVLVNILLAHYFTKYVDDPVKDFVYRFEAFMRKDKSYKEIAKYFMVEEKGGKILAAIIVIAVIGTAADAIYKIKELDI